MVFVDVDVELISTLPPLSRSRRLRFIDAALSHDSPKNTSYDLILHQLALARGNGMESVIQRRSLCCEFAVVQLLSLLILALMRTAH